MMDHIRHGNWMSWGKGRAGKDRCFMMRFESAFGTPEQRPRTKLHRDIWDEEGPCPDAARVPSWVCSLLCSLSLGGWVLWPFEVEARVLRPLYPQFEPG